MTTIEILLYVGDIMMFSWVALATLEHIRQCVTGEIIVELSTSIYAGKVLFCLGSFGATFLLINQLADPFRLCPTIRWNIIHGMIVAAMILTRQKIRPFLFDDVAECISRVYRKIIGQFKK